MARSKRERKLPVQQLFILCKCSPITSTLYLAPADNRTAICRFAEPIALTSIFPYLPEMIQSFGVPTPSISTWVGVASSTFSLCQCLTGIPWGRLSDRIGRKPVILAGLCNTMVTGLIWGFSGKLWVAILARALQGLGNGNVGIIR